MPVAVAADAIVPVIPGDEIVMSAASLAADGQLPFTPIVLVAAVAMFLGDQVMFALGRRWDAGRGAPVTPVTEPIPRPGDGAPPPTPAYGGSS